MLGRGNTGAGKAPTRRQAGEPKEGEGSKKAEVRPERASWVPLMQGVFPSLTEQQVISLVNSAGEMQKSAGKIIIAAKQPATHVYFVLSGSACVHQCRLPAHLVADAPAGLHLSSDNADNALACQGQVLIGPGTFFGEELAVQRASEYALTVTADTAVHLIRLTLSQITKDMTATLSKISKLHKDFRKERKREVPPSVMVDFDLNARRAWVHAKTKQTHVQGKGRFEDTRWRTEEVLGRHETVMQRSKDSLTPVKNRGLLSHRRRPVTISTGAEIMFQLEPHRLLRRTVSADWISGPLPPKAPAKESP
jgi:CRP-like cAMP-binding protein